LIGFCTVEALQLGTSKNPRQSAHNLIHCV
jgi:hypothetical protein